MKELEELKKEWVENKVNEFGRQEFTCGLPIEKGFEMQSWIEQALEEAFRLGQESVSLPEDEGEFNPEAENWAEPVKDFIQIKDNIKELNQ